MPTVSPPEPPIVAHASVVLLVEDDPSVRTAVARYLRLHRLQVVEAASCAAALQAFEEQTPDLVLADHHLPDGDSLQLLPRLRELDERVPVVLLTGFGTVDLAVQAVKHGADDVLTKPVPMTTVLARVRALLDRRPSAPVHQSSTRAVDRPTGSERRLAKAADVVLDLRDQLLGESPAIRSLHQQIRAMRDADCPVLILGETGSGKGVVAKLLHAVSARSARPFVDVNCAVLSREFVESELFGHARGAFTGAHAKKEGLFEVASGGTLFLDEIGDVDAAVQPKLLKAIEDRRFRRMGETQDRSVDVRLLAATHHDLLAATRTRAFRGDLFYRISTIRIDVPPLRERGSDVILLARSFLAAASGRFGRPGLRFDDGAERLLVAHAWPGNVRELRNVIDRAVFLAEDETVSPAHIRLDHESGAFATREPFSASLTLEDVERRHVEAVLGDEQWDVGRAARRLGIARSTLYLKIKAFGLRPPDARDAAASEPAIRAARPRGR